MKVQLKWFLTGKVTELEERDELLGPQTSILEVKGLVQLKYSYPAKNMLVIARKALRENDDSLAECGIVDAASAMDPANMLTVHVLSGAELEEDGDDEEDDGVDTSTMPGGSSIHEFSHDDFIKASKMLGRDLPVGANRAAAARAAPPRARPAFLDAKPAAAAGATDAATDGTSATPAAEPSSTAAATTPAGPVDVHTIFANVWYGLRKQGAEKKFGFAYPGVEEFFDFWDLRLNHDGHRVDKGRIVLELFFFGEIEKVDKGRFMAMATEHMQQLGFRIEPLGEIREAGCMYPLIAAPIAMSEAEAMVLGDEVYERFGQRPSASSAAPVRSSADNGPAGKGKDQCIVM